MAWRFRRSVKIAPGIRWNFGKRSTSLSFGPRGFKLTAGTAGVRHTIGIPGTGLSYTQMLRSGGRAGASRNVATQQGPSPAIATIDPTRFGITPSYRKRNAYLGGILMVAVAIGLVSGAESLALIGGLAFWAGLGCFAVGWLAAPPHAAAEKELQRRLSGFQAEFTDAEAALNSERCQKLLSRPGELGLRDDEVAGEIALLESYADYFDFADPLEANGNKLSAVPGHERVVGDDSCFYAVPAFLDKRGPDENGQLYLTDKRVLFLGSSLTAFPWKKVAHAERHNHALTVQRNDRQTPYEFTFNSLGEALKVEFVVKTILAAQLV